MIIKDTNTTYWSTGRKVLLRFFSCFVVLFVCSFSFHHPLIPDIGKYLSPFFEKLAAFFGDHIFHLQSHYTIKLISDSTGMYLNTFCISLISVIITIAWSFADRKPQNYDKFLYWFLAVLRYYLALQLLNYGCNKLFKWQFYVPEPNTLFTTVGNTSPDLLYWSVMGISYPYTVFTGALEVAAACFLLFRRTSLIGALLALAVIMNVLAINFSFDISVKLYSLFLLLLSVILIAPYFNSLCRFFSLRRVARPAHPALSPSHNIWHTLVKATVICLILADSLYPYIKYRNFNDDKAARPFLHGAYEVRTFVKNGDTLAPLLTDPFRWRRIFIHRRGYFITQSMNDEMLDYGLSYDTTNKKLGLEKYGDSTQTILGYATPAHDIFILSGKMNGDFLWMETKKINLDSLPVMQHGFHWTIDE